MIALGCMNTTSSTIEASAIRSTASGVASPAKKLNALQYSIMLTTASVGSFLGLGLLGILVLVICGAIVGPINYSKGKLTLAPAILGMAIPLAVGAVGLAIILMK